MRFTLGTGDAGDIVRLDVMPERPHGVVVTGYTLSGALFTRSLVQSATATHNPDALRVWLVRPDLADPSVLETNFAFVRNHLPSSDLTLLRRELDEYVEVFNRDTLLSALPHVDHMITASDSAAILADLSDAEVERRMDLFSVADAGDWAEYEWLRSRGRAHLERLPRILIQVNEFPGLLAAAEPRVAGALERISRVGRCAGIGLQLCSSTLHGGIWPRTSALLSNMSYTITMCDVDQASRRMILRLRRSQLEPASRPGSAVLHYGDDVVTFTPDSPA